MLYNRRRSLILLLDSCAIAAGNYGSPILQFRTGLVVAV